VLCCQVQAPETPQMSPVLKLPYSRKSCHYRRRCNLSYPRNCIKAWLSGSTCVLPLSFFHKTRFPHSRGELFTQPVSLALVFPLASLSLCFSTSSLTRVLNFSIPFLLLLPNSARKTPHLVAQCRAHALSLSRTRCTALTLVPSVLIAANLIVGRVTASAQPRHR